MMMKQSLSTKLKKRKFRPRLKYIKAPAVKSIKDLIEISETTKLYDGLDTIMLWRICPYLKQLEEMVGMVSLKQTVFFQIIYYLKGMHKRNIEGEFIHTVLYGNPGCGKTSVAEIIGKIYSKMGVLPGNGEFRIAHREDLVAGYLGQTAIKTKKLLKSCIGGVLFIDEAYSLGPRKSDKDSFSKEAIDTLNAFLSEHKNDFCCIIAGYKDEIKNCFFAMNKGLERRFPWVHEIEKYNSDNLYDIFKKMIKDINWEIAFEKKYLVNLLGKNKKYFEFAGGDVEAFITKCKMVHARRIFNMSEEHQFVLTQNDLDEGLKLIKENKTIIEDKPPSWMYT